MPDKIAIALDVLSSAFSPFTPMHGDEIKIRDVSISSLRRRSEEYSVIATFEHRDWRVMNLNFLKRSLGDDVGLAELPLLMSDRAVVHFMPTFLSILLLSDFSSPEAYDGKEFCRYILDRCAQCLKQPDCFSLAQVHAISYSLKVLESIGCDEATTALDSIDKTYLSTAGAARE